MVNLGYNYTSSNLIKATAAVLLTPCGHDTRKDKFLMLPQYIILPRQAIDVTGQRFGRLVALGPIGQDRTHQIIWLCQCDCGNTCTPLLFNLRGGKSRSCGCLHDEAARNRLTTHGLKNHPLHITWTNMLFRCMNSNYTGYKNYGGRGIAVCSEWQDDFKAFYDYASQLPHCGEKGYSIDRINNDGNYEPGNVRWATRLEQNLNRRMSRTITFDGRTQSLTAWADEVGVTPRLLRYRLKAGWSLERVLGLDAESLLVQQAKEELVKAREEHGTA